MSDSIPPITPGPSEPAVASEITWTLLLSLAERRRQGITFEGPVGLTLSADHELQTVPPADPTARLIWSDQGLGPAPHQGVEIQDLISLYAPLFPPEPCRSMVLGHLGQSIDANIATQSGDSQCVTGPANILHLHRLRALCDAIIVGAGTAAADDPRLTTRLVPGPNPVRVVIDPERRVSAALQLFNDGEATSLTACAADLLQDNADNPRFIGLKRNASGDLDLADLVVRLQARGLYNLFIEGGGITVSRWLTAGLLDRLHVTIAPLFIGKGRAAIDLPPAARMTACLRPPSRVYRLGEDLLWDFDLRAEKTLPSGADKALAWPRRVV
jgi:riboflavin-specific deaminase-like protein